MPIRFQVDPDFYDHPKTLGMSDAATALWVRAGSYSAAKRSDGFVADAALALLSQSPEEAARELTRRGLWSRVKGGYLFHQWSERNLTRARIDADRKSDRDRKRRGRESGGQIEKPQVESQVVRADSQPESEGNPDGFQPLSVSLFVSESVSGSGHDDVSGPPPDRCPNHIDDPDPPPCGGCREARLANEGWAAGEVQRGLRVAQLQRQQTAHARAEAARLAIARCGQCDPTGYLPSGGVCPHDPAAGNRARRGAAEARAALARKESA